MGILQDNKKFLASLAKELFHHPQMNATHFQEFSQQYGVNLSVANPKHYVSHGYAAMLDQYFQQIKED